MKKLRTLSAVAAAAMMISDISLTAFAYDGSYDTLFTFSDTGVTAEDVSADNSASYEINGTSLTLSGSGTYVVTGSASEGNVEVKKNAGEITLVVSDLSLTSSENAVLTIGKNSDVELVAEGTSTLRDAEDPEDENSEGAAIKVKSGGSLTITGDGTLNVDGSDCKNGIKGASEAEIVIGGSEEDDFTLNVSAANNGIASDGSVVINGGNVNVTAAGDGIKASPEEDDTVSAGTVTVNGGNIDITSTDDGIQADKGLTVTGAVITIRAGGGSSAASEDNSAKGLKSDSYIVITGGTLNVDAADDGIHLNGTQGTEKISITGGTVTVSSGDDGIHSDYYLDIGNEDGSGDAVINILKSAEGLEGAVINLYSGKGSITTSDDGVNAANSDLTGYSFSLNISGGIWYINAGGDGLDSNGDLNISGGTTEVYGSANGGNGAFDYGDYGNSFNVSGGTAAGIGTSDMAAVPTSGTYLQFGTSSGMGGQGGMQGMMPPAQDQQNAQMTEGGAFPGGMPFGTEGNMQGRTPQDMQQNVTQPAEQENMPMGFGAPQGNTASSISINAGQTVEIKDSEGNTLFTAVSPKSANSLVFASENLESGSEYTLYIDGEAVQTVLALEGNGQGMGMFGGLPGQMPQTDEGTEPPAFPEGTEEGQMPRMDESDGPALIPEEGSTADKAEDEKPAEEIPVVTVKNDIENTLSDPGIYYFASADTSVSDSSPSSAAGKAGNAVSRKTMVKLIKAYVKEHKRASAADIRALFAENGFSYRGSSSISLNGVKVWKGLSENAVKVIEEVTEDEGIEFSSENGEAVLIAK
ncbi:MAG: carbohydrate-binding domain-containing protein [Oscillospiraceae bacterium]|nr:carbohydrate-binding domain-containing protein [Oscillospiraceae bacterium]